MRQRLKLNSGVFSVFVFLLAAFCISIGAAGCGSSKPSPAQQAAQPDSGPKRYPFSGRVVSVDKPKLQVVVDGADIPGFMMAMTMPYDVKTANVLDPVSPEDQIKAEVVVNGNDVYLENIQVTKKADPAKAPVPGSGGAAAPKSDKP